jgi:hypothetical protein
VLCRREARYSATDGWCAVLCSVVLCYCVGGRQGTVRQMGCVLCCCVGGRQGTVRQIGGVLCCVVLCRREARYSATDGWCAVLCCAMLCCCVGGRQGTV